jgi:hypothetical protein
VGAVPLAGGGTTAAGGVAVSFLLSQATVENAAREKSATRVLSMVGSDERDGQRNVPALYNARMITSQLFMPPAYGQIWQGRAAAHCIHVLFLLNTRA